MKFRVGLSTPLTLNSQAGRIDSPNPSLIHRGTGTVVPRTSSRHLSGSPATRSHSSPTPSTEHLTETPTSPNIVARLQQLHGLTKKKLYASTSHPPPRTPFFSNEPADTGPPQAPSQPLIPRDVEEYISHSYPLSNSGGRVQTRARGERKNRLALRNTTSPKPTQKGKVAHKGSLSFSDHVTTAIPPPSPHTTYNPTPSPMSFIPSDVVLSVGPCEPASSQNASSVDSYISSTGTTHEPKPISGPLQPLQPDGYGQPTLPHLTSTLAASYGTSTAFGPSTLPPATTHNPCIEGAAIGTATTSSIEATQCTGINSWTQPASLGSDHLVPYRWGGHHDFMASSSSHASGDNVEYQGDMNVTQLLGNENTQEAGSYLPVPPQYFCPNPSDTGANFDQSHALPDSEPSRANTMMSTMSGGGDNIPVNSPEEAIPQPSTSFCHGSRAGLELDSLPRFYPSSSSSLSAMINPRLYG
ncbi:hypothetical protein D9756_009077 [Leucocoprinus leucothites]|uniref:Uncharacterized protein n=1 Tax=Leucocoprinus leucothites TaxID=201217 RepID=A0A8H5CXZ6_9AGAR|nr:hypothetical protein D9756_009077 [Leucoagaricus leucothites]